MIIPTVKTHPLMEILAKALFSLESIPEYHRRRVINDAIKKAVKYHDKVLADHRELLFKKRSLEQSILNELGDTCSKGKCAQSRIHLIDEILKETKWEQYQNYKK